MTAGQLLARGGRNPPCQTPVVFRGTASKPNPANRPGCFGACREMTRHATLESGMYWLHLSGQRTLCLATANKCLRPAAHLVTVLCHVRWFFAAIVLIHCYAAISRLSIHPIPQNQNSDLLKVHIAVSLFAVRHHFKAVCDPSSSHAMTDWS